MSRELEKQLQDIRTEKQTQEKKIAKSEATIQEKFPEIWESYQNELAIFDDIKRHEKQTIDELKQSALDSGYTSDNVSIGKRTIASVTLTDALLRAVSALGYYDLIKPHVTKTNGSKWKPFANVDGVELTEETTVSVKSEAKWVSNDEQ